MVLGEKNNIFNIPTNYHFFESFFDFLHSNFAGKISQLKILLPSQRSCRELRRIFIEKTSDNQAVIMPQIKAISDLSFEDLFEFLPNPAIEQTIQEIVAAQKISGVEHLFFLSQEILKQSLFGENIDAAQLLMIATHLKNTFDEIEREEVEFSKFTEIDDSDLSKHRQMTVEFLQKFHFGFRNSLIKQDVFFDSSWQNFIISKIIEILQNYGCKNHWIIAGSTGSVMAGRKLIKAIAQCENGFVVLHGADLSQNNYSAENHPQYHLNNLINFLGIEKSAVKNLANSRYLISSQTRLEMMQTVMLPSKNTDQWQKSQVNFDDKISLVEAKNEIEEAQIIAVILAKNYAENKKCAVVINDNKIAKLLRIELKKRGMIFNDTRNFGVFDANLVKFILLILDLIENDFTSSSLLAVWQNQLFNHENKAEIIAEFEIKILRQDRKNFGLDGIKSKLRDIDNIELEEFFADFCAKISPILQLQKNDNIANCAQAILQAVVNLSQKTLQEIFAEEEAQQELFEFFTKIAKQKNFIVRSDNLLSIFQILFGQVSFFEKSDASALIQILSTIEARLLNFDLMIVASLNEGKFPEITSESWLGRKIRKDLGIEKTLKKIGQNAYDFCNYLANKEVVLTRSLTYGGSPSSPSLFLLKLQTLAKKSQFTFNDQAELRCLLNNFDDVEVTKISRPQPKIDWQLRPKKLAITDIAKLISDPYSIYAKRVLRLRELQKIDYEPSYSEFGSFVHKALEEFVKNPQNLEIALQNSHIIFQQYFLNEEAQLIWWPKFQNIFHSFFDQERAIKASSNLTEVEVKIIIEEILLNGKIDRVAISDNKAQIYDYKTGQVATTKDVICGKEPQLTIAALMLIESGFNYEISALNYWKLSFAGGEKIVKISQDCEEIKIMAAAAKAGIAKIFQYFSDPRNSYTSAPDLDNYKENEYSHLARVKEWQ